MRRTAVRRADDQCEPVQRGIIEPILGDEGVETALVAVVAQFDVRHIVGNRTGLGGDLHHFAVRHIEEFRVLVDEARHQPRTGNAVDLGSFAGDPFHGDFLNG